MEKVEVLMVTIKCVESLSDGCHSSSTYCDGSVHFSIESMACHHTQDWDNPNDPSYRVMVGACNPEKHHDAKTCYNCNSDHDADNFECRFYRDAPEDDTPYVDPWNYEWSEFQDKLIATWKESLAVDEDLCQEIPWTQRVSVYPNMTRKG